MKTCNQCLMKNAIFKCSNMVYVSEDEWIQCWKCDWDNCMDCSIGCFLCNETISSIKEHQKTKKQKTLKQCIYLFCVNV